MDTELTIRQDAKLKMNKEYTALQDRTPRAYAIAADGGPLYVGLTSTRSDREVNYESIGFMVQGSRKPPPLMVVPKNFVIEHGE